MSELRDEIAKVIDNNALDFSGQYIADEIFALPALVELQKDAERWRKVVEIASYVERDGCKDCPLDNTCDRSISMCNLAYALIDTLTGEGEG